MSSTNLEEAASVAAEYVSSLDNLPSETQHLLSEIRVRDSRSHELQQEIQKESSKFIRHSLRSGTPGQTLSAKDGTIPETINQHYAELDRLAAEKEALANRLVQLIERARARLAHDLSKVLALQGYLDPATAQSGYSAARDPVQKANEIIRNSIAIPELPATPAASSGPPQKKRKTMPVASAGSIKLPSPAPMSAAPSYGTGQRSRVHTRQSPLRSRRVTESAGPDIDEDAEGEDDLEEGMDDSGDAEDKRLYCFCQKLSYGEMIACDNADCRYQWFHLPCVNLKPPLPENWFCEDCISRMKGTSSTVGTGRKGRKK